MIGIAPLASGSKGNCIYIGTPEIKILIDAGLSGKETLKRLASIGVSIEEIDAILLTHEHGDHIAGLKTLAFKYQIPIFANAGTAHGVIDYLKTTPKLKIFTTGEPFEFGDLLIQSFSIPHDTLDPVAFTFETPYGKIGLCTDLGYITSQISHRLQGCRYLIIEANHEVELVHCSLRPTVYKERVLGPSGHLSNEDCAKLLTQVAHPELEVVYLAHLSSECNSPQKALHTVSNYLAENALTMNLRIAYQDRPSEAVLIS